MRIHRLNSDDAFARILREVREAQRQAPLGNSSVSKGRTRFVGEHSLLVEGSADIIGTLYGSNGTLQWDGPANFTEDTTVGGTLVVNADTTLKKNLIVEAITRLLGAVTLETGMTVKSGGKVTVEGADPMTLGLIGGAPGVGFSSGGSLKGFTNGLRLDSGGGSVVSVVNALAQMTHGAYYVQVSDSGVAISGPAAVAGALNTSGALSNTGMTSKSGVTANVHIDSAGRLWKVG